MGKCLISASTPTQASSSSTDPDKPHLRNQIGLWMVLTALLLGVTMLLSACGPAPSRPDETALSSELQRIAQDYVGGGSLEQARAAVDGLSVANPRQWLAVKAEEAVSAGPGDGTAAIVKLAVGLKAASGVVLQFAAQNGLVDPTPTPAPLARTTPIAIDAAAPAVPAAAPVAAGAATTTTLPAAAVITATSEAAAALSLPTATPAAVAAEAAGAPSGPVARADGLINVRSGPGTEYGLAGALQPAEAVAIVARNAAGDWWEVELAGGQTGWVLGQLVQTSGDTGAVAVAANIPAPPPTATPAPAQAADPVVQAPEAVVDPAATATPEPTATADPNAKPYFKLVARRMWSKSENGGCSGQHLLRLHVIDANGIRINGVRLKGVYTGEIVVTGSQGKGDGVIEYDLYSGGEGFEVIQNDDGREAASDRAEGFTTNSLEIDMPTLIGAGYCTNEADCQIFYSSYGCDGHHSWEATFQRNY
jgi:uncharacterized protein YraI